MQLLQESKSLINYRNQKKKYDKTVLLGKVKLDTNQVQISKDLSDSYISFDEFVSVNNELKNNLR